MKINSIKLTNFRNYETLDLKFDEKINIFIGNNAQGKTNILESIYVSSIGKSFRTSRDGEMIRFGSEYFIIRVCAEKNNEPLPVEIAVLKDGTKGIKVDGIKIKKMSALLRHIYCVIFSPEDLKIVKEEPEKRRVFIDKTLSRISISYYNDIYEYKKIIKQRNALLKEIRKGSAADMLVVWDEKLAATGANIIIKRDAFIKKLAMIAEGFHVSITGGSEKSEIYYEPDVEVCSSRREQKEKIMKALSESEQRDIKNGSTSRGPHKDDICIKTDGVDIRNFGSQGQQRTAALSLKLSELNLIREETGETPILLLDDVMSELDAFRQNFLIQSLEDVQLFVTTTELTEEVKKALVHGKIFKVLNGTVSE